MALTPSSWYSRLETHIFLNVSRDARMEPLNERKKKQHLIIQSNMHQIIQMDNHQCLPDILTGA